VIELHAGDRVRLIAEDGPPVEGVLGADTTASIRVTMGVPGERPVQWSVLMLTVVLDDQPGNPPATEPR
jgi:hypothetical protein